MDEIIKTEVSRIDAMTGELVGKKTTEKKAWLWDDMKGLYMFPRHSVVMSWHHIPIWHKITDGEIVRLHRLAPYLSEGNVLVDDNHYPLTALEIGKVVKLAAGPNIYPWLKRMDLCGVIRKSGKAFYINPLYMTTSRYLPPELYTLFQTEIDPHLTKFGKDKFKGDNL